MSEPGSLWAAHDDPSRPAAHALAWLWRLGPLGDGPTARSVGFTSTRSHERLTRLVGSGEMAGAVVFCGPDSLPGLTTVEGVARFGDGTRSRGRFGVFAEGRPLASSSLGHHAVVRDGTLLVGCAAEGWWGRVEHHWVPHVIAAYLEEVTDHPLTRLPAVGVARLDDAPGTAQHQMEGRSKPDRAGRKLVEGLHKTYESHGAVLNMAVAAEGLDDGARVDLDRVWPQAVDAIRAGVQAGALESVCHGLLHLVPEAMERGEVEFKEFEHLDEEEAGRRIDQAMAWHERHLGRRPATFCAPAWGYSAGSREAARARELPVWLPPEAGPLVADGGLRETLDPALHGLVGFDFSPFARWAEAGIPPTLVFHGRTFDLRMPRIREGRDVLGLLRTLRRRDIYRVPRTPGVQWIGAGAYAELLEAHALR